MILNILFTLVGAVTFLYLFWKKLKDDYSHNQIFIAGFYVLIGMFLFNLLALYFVPAWSFWLSLLGSLFGLAVGISRFRLRIFELLEGWVFGGIGLLFVFYVYMWIGRFSIKDFLPILVMFLFISLYLFLDSKYKKFSWYKSGRVGFAGLATMGLFFLLRSLVAFFEPSMLFFVERYDVWLSGIMSFVAFLLLFNLSRKTL